MRTGVARKMRRSERRSAELCPVLGVILNWFGFLCLYKESIGLFWCFGGIWDWSPYILFVKETRVWWVTLSRVGVVFFFFNFKPKREISFNKTRVPFFCNQISEKFFSLNVRNSRVEYEWRWKCVEASFWLECLVYSTWVTVLQFLAYLVVAYRFLTEFWLLRKCVSVCNWVCVSNCATMSGWCELPFYIGSLVRPEGTLLPTIFFFFQITN